MNYDLSGIAKQLKDNFSAYAREYSDEVNRSYKKRLETLAPGRPAPEKNLTDEERAAFRARSGEYRRRAEAIIENAKKQVQADITAAPSTEATNYITLLSSRNHLTVDELNLAMDTYGENYSCYNALKDIAKNKNVGIYNDHPLDAAFEDIKAFETNNKYYAPETFATVTPETASMLYASGIDGKFFGV